MGVTLEPESWSGRAGSEHHIYGDKYTITFKVIKSMPDVARITSMVCKEEFIWRKELAVKLKAEGFVFAIWERIKDGKMVYVKVKL